MKFTAIKSNRISIDGITVIGFVKGTEYDLPEETVIALRKFGIAPGADGRKAADPVRENKMAHPVIDNKLTLKK